MLKGSEKGVFAKEKRPDRGEFLRFGLVFPSLFHLKLPFQVCLYDWFCSQWQVVPVKRCRFLAGEEWYA